MGTWSGIIYASGTIVASQNSGWLDMHEVVGRPVYQYDTPWLAIRAATLRLVPADLATDETLDLDLNVAWDSAGATDLKLHDFTQVTATNAKDTLVLPGGESEDVLVSLYNGAGEAAHKGQALIPPYWKFTSTVGGTTKSMQYTFYGTIWW